MLVALPSSIAFGVLIYTALGPEYGGEGAMAGILGAAALGLIAPAIGRTAGLISAPCAPAAAVLSALVASLPAGRAGLAAYPAGIFPLVALTCLFAALLQILYGAIGGGRLIKFIPYPVVSGYLSGVGLLIALGQLPKLLGIPSGVPLLRGLLSPAVWSWEGLVVGMVTIGVMATAPRITGKVPAAILGLFSGILAYFMLAFFSPALLVLQDNRLLIGSIPVSGFSPGVLLGRARSLLSLDLPSVWLILPHALTLSVLLSIDTLKTCVGLDAMTRTRHKSDRELMGQGIGNLASSLLGGLPGAGTMGPTLINVNSGGRTFRSGVLEGGFVLLALLLLGRMIAWVPVAALAGILLVLAWRMFDRGMFRLLGYPAGRLDFAVVAAVVVVSLTFDLITAAGTGITLAILLFIRDQIRGTVIRRKFYLHQMSSMTLRLPAERELLDRNGDQGLCCELQGNLFFGTTDQLFTQLEHDLGTARYILFDLRRVQSLDYTAAHMFEQMNAQLAERGGQLLFSGMPSALLDQRNFEHYLVQLGMVKKEEGVMIAGTFDSALEWMEERILEAAGVRRSAEEEPLAIKDFTLFRKFDEGTIRALEACITEKSLAPGETVFSKGDPGDELFLVRRGSIRILLPLEGGKHHHVATVGRGDFFGELSFLDRGLRSADAEAKGATDLYLLSRSRFNAEVLSTPVMGAQVFARLAIAIAERLRRTNSELHVLVER